MRPGLKLSKDKRHRSSSSLAEHPLESTQSERKLDHSAIPEGEAHFAAAAACCDMLQERIEMNKDLKKKRRLAKRSLTHLEAVQPGPTGQAAGSPRRSVGVRGPHPAAPGDLRRPGQLHDARSTVMPPTSQPTTETKPRTRRHRADDGETLCPYSPQRPEKLEPGRGDFNLDNYYNPEIDRKRSTVSTQIAPMPREGGEDRHIDVHRKPSEALRKVRQRGHAADGSDQELFNQRNNLTKQGKYRGIPNFDTKFNDQVTGPLEKQSSQEKSRRRIARRSSRYQLPTLSSQLKQTNKRYCYEKPYPMMPFVISASTSPSHNIGVNLQQVLNGVKIQQPLSGIPLTIAHHMGLRHMPTALDLKDTKTPQVPELDNREINVLTVGDKFVRLPSYKTISYNRLLTLYKEGEGFVPRFLRALTRPHFFYTSMYNLNSMRDFDGSTSKAQYAGASGEAKRSLKEYAALYKEYEKLNTRIGDGDKEKGLQRRRDQLAQELAQREEGIRRIVEDFRTVSNGQSSVRGSLSHTEDMDFRHSTMKVNLGAPT